MKKLPHIYLNFSKSQYQFLLISVIIGGLVAGSFYLPFIASLGIAMLLLPLSLMVGFIIVVLKNPQNHYTKFILAIFGGYLLGFCLVQFVAQEIFTTLEFGIYFGLLLLILYSILQKGINPDNAKKPFHPIIFTLGCLGVCWTFGITVFLQPFALFCTAFAVCLWVFQWFLTPISHKVLGYKLCNVALMVVFLLTYAYYQQIQLQQAGDNLRWQISNFKQKNGVYPTPVQLNMPVESPIHYSFDPQNNPLPTPMLIYRDVRNPYCMMIFDFTKPA